MVDGNKCLEEMMNNSELLKIFKFEVKSDEIKTVLDADVLNDAIQNLEISKKDMVKTLRYMTNNKIDSEYLKAWGLTFAHIYYNKYENDIKESEHMLHSSNDFEYLLYNGTWNGEMFYVLQSIRSVGELIDVYGYSVAIDTFGKLINDIHEFDDKNPYEMRLTFNSIRLILMSAKLRSPDVSVEEITANYPDHVRMIREFEAQSQY